MSGSCTTGHTTHRGCNQHHSHRRLRHRFRRLLGHTHGLSIYLDPQLDLPLGTGRLCRKPTTTTSACRFIVECRAVPCDHIDLCFEHGYLGNNHWRLCVLHASKGTENATGVLLRDGTLCAVYSDDDSGSCHRRLDHCHTRMGRCIPSGKLGWCFARDSGI